MSPIYDQPDERPNFFRERPDLFDRQKRRGFRWISRNSGADQEEQCPMAHFRSVGGLATLKAGETAYWETTYKNLLTKVSSRKRPIFSTKVPRTSR
jgi:hypothetical protein